MIEINSHSEVELLHAIRKSCFKYTNSGAMVHRRPVYIHLLNVPSFSSRYFNKIKRSSRLGRVLALSLEILCFSLEVSKLSLVNMSINSTTIRSKLTNRKRQVWKARDTCLLKIETTLFLLFFYIYKKRTTKILIKTVHSIPYRV